MTARFLSVAQAAEICHEANRSLCLMQGDKSQPRWELAPDWQQISATNGVLFHLANPDATPEGSHESWLAEKAAEGWKYGEIKNPDAREHPCFRPYSELPAQQQAKDHLFRSIVHGLRDFIAQ